MLSRAKGSTSVGWQTRPSTTRFRRQAPDQRGNAVPQYDYRCDACEHEFEVDQSIKDDPICKCPKCGKKKVKRLISAGTTFVLQGKGWFKDGY